MINGCRMIVLMTPHEFIEKWVKGADHLSERAAAQSHFSDLCEMLGQPKPYTEDPTGSTFAFEKAVKVVGKKDKGFADVWKKDHFAIEYKRKGRSLSDAYLQLSLYREDLGNPPLLIVSDLRHFEIHTNFTGTTKQVYAFDITQFTDPKILSLLQRVFTEPHSFDPSVNREGITKEASSLIGDVALRLQNRGHEARAVAHFLMQLVFAFFADSIQLLPQGLITRILKRTQKHPERAQDYLTQLFTAMATGGEVLLEEIRHFNGGLYEGSPALPLETEEIGMLLKAAELDWAEVEPAIFGTLLERSLDPKKRSQLGAHYTSREDINKVIQPVIFEDLKQEWDHIRTTATTYLASPHEHPGTHTQRINTLVKAPVAAFLQKIQSIKVLDAACGSGNFLYVAMQTLKDLELDVLNFAREVKVGGLPLVSPKQFYGLELNPFAHEIASVVVWIGYLQWNRAHGQANAQNPILERLNNIELRDALLNPDGTETQWPEANYIVGNPPFLGNTRMKQAFKDQPGYVAQLYATYGDRVPRKSDLVCYWFEKARAAVHSGITKRAGLISTNSIRGGVNRKVLERIKEHGDIFMAHADLPWMQEGAAVRVSIVAFDNGTESTRTLDGQPVEFISSSLTSTDLSQIKVIPANKGISFKGLEPAGKFDVPAATARAWSTLLNLSGRSNTDVLKPYINAKDLTQKPSNRWLIDFNNMPLEEAELYEVPLAHVREHVKPKRDENGRPARRDRWWIHGENRPAMRAALAPLSRYIATPRHSKFRVFTWLTPDQAPDSALVVIARDDDYMLGVLSSIFHEVWALTLGTNLGVGNDPRYTSTTCFETFPFPEPTDAQRQKIGQLAAHLMQVRNNLLTQIPNSSLTSLYNALEEVRLSNDTTNPMYSLKLIHDRLDLAVAEAYGWSLPLPRNQILTHLIELNAQRTANLDTAPPIEDPEEDEESDA